MDVRRPNQNETFDASPDKAPKGEIPKYDPVAESKKSVNQMWARYLSTLQVLWKDMPRARQMELVEQTCQIMSTGLSIVALSFIYSYLPIYVRLILAPVIAIAAWWLGGNVLAPVVVERFERFLNK